MTAVPLDLCLGIDMKTGGLYPALAKGLFRWFFYTLVGMGILAVDPFGLGSLSEEGSQKILYEIGGPFYGKEARDDITLVLIGEQSLQKLYADNKINTNEWPLLYGDWQVLLKAIAANGPRAVFVDVYFEQERVTDTSFHTLERALSKLRERTPIYLAGGTPPYDTPLQEKLGQIASLVGTSWEGYGRGIPLQQNGEPMAALALYREACGPGKTALSGCAGTSEWTNGADAVTAAMSVIWGSSPALPLAAINEGQGLEEFCSNESASLGDLAVGIARSAAGALWQFLPFVQEGGGHDCLFHRVVDADELMRVFDDGTDEEQMTLRSVLQNKVVLVGTKFEGLPDFVETPGMGLVPGVALHAMMLDNLMKYGQDYVRIAGLNTLPYNGLIWSMIVLILVWWIGYREWRHGGDSKSLAPGSSVPFIGWGATAFFVVSLGLVFLAALFTYYVFRFEPSNAIGFLGLAEVTRRIYGKNIR